MFEQRLLCFGVFDASKIIDQFIFIAITGPYIFWEFISTIKLSSFQLNIAPMGFNNNFVLIDYYSFNSPTNKLLIGCRTDFPLDKLFD